MLMLIGSQSSGDLYDSRALYLLMVLASCTAVGERRAPLSQASSPGVPLPPTCRPEPRDMKIIYLHQYFTTPSMHGGTRSYELARRLVGMGHEVHMVTSDTQPAPRREGLARVERERHPRALAAGALLQRDDVPGSDAGLRPASPSTPRGGPRSWRATWSSPRARR